MKTIKERLNAQEMKAQHKCFEKLRRSLHEKKDVVKAIKTINKIKEVAQLRIQKAKG